MPISKIYRQSDRVQHQMHGSKIKSNNNNDNEINFQHTYHSDKNLPSID